MRYSVKFTCIIYIISSLPCFGLPVFPSVTELKCEGCVRILGESNLGNFELIYRFAEYPFKPSLPTLGEENSPQLLTMPVHGFDAESALLKSDFMELLKAREHPFIKLKFLNLEDLDPSEALMQLEMEIIMAGISNPYIIDCEIYKASPTTISLAGNTEISIKDFDLEPPKRFFGLIRVREHINVDFSVNFTIANESN